MSSYVCNYKHFNSIEQNLGDLIKFDNDFYLPYQLEQIYPNLAKNKLHETIETELEKIVDHLREINVVCVTLQYSNNLEGINQEIRTQLQQLKLNKKDSKKLSIHGLYNALKCLNYQLELDRFENTIGLTEDQKNAVQFLDEIKTYLAALIVSKLPDDRTNTWEVE